MYRAGNRGGGPGMRVSHLANIVVAFTTFGTSYLLFHGQQPLANLSANQLENTQQSAFAKKSDRLAIKEEEEEEDQVVSPKVVRLEKYALPASDEENPPKLDLSYLADYAYSEVPLDKKPADIVLDALKNIPIGKPIEEIKLASEAFGLDFNFMKAVAKIESDFDPKQHTGSYIGLFQLSKGEFARYGSGDILNPRDNAVAAAYKFATAAMLFELNTHKKATFSDLYLIHQQGTRGAEEHVNHPDRIAWKSMCDTDEGREKGEKWCKRAIWKNTLPELKQIWKSVDNLTSGAFVKMWQDRVDRFYTHYSEATTN
jgi:Transglycosylase SLT domain